MSIHEKENRILKQLNEAIDEGIRRSLIILRGPFQSGKTGILKKLIQERQLQERRCYLNLNQYLIKKVNEEIDTKSELNYEVLSRLKAKTSNLFKKVIEEYLSEYFVKNDFLVIDAVELLINYQLNLPQVALPWFGERKTIIIAVPYDEYHQIFPDWSFNLGKVIEMN